MENIFKKYLSKNGVVKNSAKVDMVVNAYKSVENTADPNGSYTGVADSADQKPVQDADDL